MKRNRPIQLLPLWCTLTIAAGCAEPRDELGGGESVDEEPDEELEPQCEDWHVELEGSPEDLVIHGESIWVRTTGQSNLAHEFDLEGNALRTIDLGAYEGGYEDKLAAHDTGIVVAAGDQFIYVNGDEQTSVPRPGYKLAAYGDLVVHTHSDDELRVIATDIDGDQLWSYSLSPLPDPDDPDDHTYPVVDAISVDGTGLVVVALRVQSESSVDTGLVRIRDGKLESSSYDLWRNSLDGDLRGTEDKTHFFYIETDYYGKNSFEVMNGGGGGGGRSFAGLDLDLWRLDAVGGEEALVVVKDEPYLRVYRPGEFDPSDPSEPITVEQLVTLEHPSARAAKILPDTSIISVAGATSTVSATLARTCTQDWLGNVIEEGE